MKFLKALQACLKACCLIGKEPHLDKINHDLHKMEKEVMRRATVDGEDDWFLRTELRNHKRCNP